MVFKHFSRGMQLASHLHTKFVFKNIFIPSIKNHFSTGRVSLSDTIVTQPSNTTNDNAENKYVRTNFKVKYHQYLLENSNYYQTVFRSELLLGNGSCNCKSLELLREFNNTGNVDILKDLAIYIKKELSTLKFNELLELLNLFFNSNHHKQDSKIWSELESEINNKGLSRVSSLSLDQRLTISDFGVGSLHFRNTKFFWKIHRKCISNVEKLNHQQLVHFFYTMLIYSKFSLREDKFKLQCAVYNMYPHLNFTEFGFIMGTFNAIGLKLSHTKLVSEILTRCTKNIENVNPVNAESIFGGLAKSCKYEHVSLINALQEAMIPCISKFNLPSLVDSISIGLMPRCLNFTLAKEVMKKLKNNITGCTLYKIERTTLLCALFNIKDEEFLKLAISRIESKIEKINPTVLLRFISWLVHFRCYPTTLLENILSQNFIAKHNKEKKALRHWLLTFITHSLELDMAQYNGIKLDEETKQKIWKVGKHSTNKNMEYVHLNFISKSFYEVMNSLKMMYGENACVQFHPIAFYTCGILMRFNKNLKAQIIPEEYLAQKGLIIKPLDDDHYWIYIFLVQPYNFFEGDFNLITQTHIRHVTALGYKLLLIPKFQWYNSKLINPTSYLENLINAKLQEDLQESHS